MISRSLVLSLALAGGVVAAPPASSPPAEPTLAPGLSVGGTDLGGLSRSDALAKLRAALPAAPQVQVTAGSQNWTVAADTLGYATDLDASLQPALAASSDQNLLDRLRTLVGAPPRQDFPLVHTVDAAVAKAALAKLTAPLAQAPKDARIIFDKTRYALTPDQPGVSVDVNAAAQSYAANPDLTALSVTVKTQPARYSASALQPLVDQGNALMRQVKVSMAGKPGVSAITPLQLANLYWVRPGGIEPDQDAIARTVKRLAGDLDRPAHDARYAAKGGQLMKVAGINGVVVDQAAALKVVAGLLTDPTTTALTLPSKASQPAIGTADLPDPGALTLIATGKSTYYGSHAERMTNIAVAASKLNGVVIPAGATFSFLNTIGHINEDNGFVSGLIISGGRTVEGLGGGVCQVSTTTFRALYTAGLPIVERNQHAYRVGYYEPQVGFEAAVYDPGLDLRMKNDTGGPLLLRTVNTPSKHTLDIQVWGVKQSRTVKVLPATILSRTPHPPAQYVVNSALKPGQQKQVDWAADGYKLYISRSITDASGTRSDRVDTNYKPWRAVYEVGPSAVPAARPVKPAAPPST